MNSVTTRTAEQLASLLALLPEAPATMFNEPMMVIYHVQDGKLHLLEFHPISTYTPSHWLEAYERYEALPL